jgi:hypothetical protein
VGALERVLAVDASALAQTDPTVAPWQTTRQLAAAG